MVTLESLALVCFAMLEEELKAGSTSRRPQLPNMSLAYEELVSTLDGAGNDW